MVVKRISTRDFFSPTVIDADARQGPARPSRMLATVWDSTADGRLRSVTRSRQQHRPANIVQNEAPGRGNAASIAGRRLTAAYQQRREALINSMTTETAREKIPGVLQMLSPPRHFCGGALTGHFFRDRFDPQKINQYFPSCYVLPELPAGPAPLSLSRGDSRYAKIGRPTLSEVRNYHSPLVSCLRSNRSRLA